MQYNRDMPLPDMGMYVTTPLIHTTSACCVLCRESTRQVLVQGHLTGDIQLSHSHCGESHACHMTWVPTGHVCMHVYTFMFTHACLHVQGALSSNFTCDLEVEGYLNKQLSDLQHPYLQTINELKFLIKDNKKQVGIIQPCWELGSLKDLVYKVRLACWELGSLKDLVYKVRLACWELGSLKDLVYKVRLACWELGSLKDLVYKVRLACWELGSLKDLVYKVRLGGLYTASYLHLTHTLLSSPCPPVPPCSGLPISRMGSEIQ